MALLATILDPMIDRMQMMPVAALLAALLVALLVDLLADPLMALLALVMEVGVVAVMTHLPCFWR